MEDPKRRKHPGQVLEAEPDSSIPLPDPSLSDACRKMLAKQATAFTIRDQDFEPLYANPAFYELFGISPEDWMQGPSVAHFGHKAREIMETKVVPALLAGKMWRGEIEINRPDGEQRQILAELSCVQDDDGEVTHFYSMYQDVTLPRRLEADLQNQLTFLNDIIDTLPEAVIVKDSKHQWIVVNEQFCDLAGPQREELLGKSDHDFFPKEQADIFWKQDDLALETDQPNTNEEKITVADGTTRLLSTTKRSLTRSDGSKVIVALGRDITAKRQLEKSMAESYQQLENVLASLKAGLTHLQSGIAAEAAKSDAVQGLISRSNENFRHYLKETGLSPATPGPVPGKASSPLSPREYQVALLLAKGLRVKDIASHLRVSPNTVSTYRTRIMTKLGFDTHTELVQYAMRSGLL